MSGTDEQERIDHGALVGWTAQNLGERVALNMQSVTKPPPHTKDDVHDFHFLLDRQQAIQLGYFLFKVTGETPPPSRKPGFLGKLFGN